jgi:hypothetical protein
MQKEESSAWERSGKMRKNYQSNMLIDKQESEVLLHIAAIYHNKESE